MNKLSQRLMSLVEYTEKSDSLVDVGADHGYLSAYLVKNNLVKKVIASDVNLSALNNAFNTFKRENLDIETILSDGLENISLEDINTLVISGMGTKTILHILEDKRVPKYINKLILQTNNDYHILRSKLNEKGYFLESETILKEKNKWYITMKFIKNFKRNDQRTIKYGYLNNEEYKKYLIKKQKEILKKIPITSIIPKLKTFIHFIKLKNAIKHK